MSAFSRSMQKNDIRDSLVDLADMAGFDLSRSRADKLASRYKQGAPLAEITAFLGRTEHPVTGPIYGAPRFKSRSVAYRPSRTTTGKHHAN